MQELRPLSCQRHDHRFGMQYGGLEIVKRRVGVLFYQIFAWCLILNLKRLTLLARTPCPNRAAAYKPQLKPLLFFIFASIAARMVNAAAIAAGEFRGFSLGLFVSASAPVEKVFAEILLIRVGFAGSGYFL